MIDSLSAVTDKANVNECFRHRLRQEFEQYLKRAQLQYPAADCLQVDLHCHDHNSDVPDELWGRLLQLPETWLKTKKLAKVLRNHGSDVVTVTNHNNARSCWELQDKGIDVLVAAEFTCYFNEYKLFVHVLTYGFDRQQEKILNEKRHNIYDFVRYAAAENIPLILPHPLYFYTRNEKIDLSLFEKFAVMFERFEVLNGQRDTWQSVLTLNWARSLTEEKILAYADKHKLDPAEFGVDPSRPKVLTGGSDCHMGIFAGQCGSYLYVPNLQNKLQTNKPSELALEAIKKGHIMPFGQVAENQKLNIALLDYISQVATRIEDPGLLRLMFHRGEISDKVLCFIIGNLLLEMQKHKNTQKFFKFVHKALSGKKPGKLVKWKIKKEYRFCIDQLERIADARNTRSPEEYIDTVNNAISELYRDLNQLIIKRTKKSLENRSGTPLSAFSTAEITRKFEVPLQLTKLLKGGSNASDMSGFNMGQLLDSLSFPVLISIILTGATLGSTRLLYQNRQFLNDFSNSLGENQHPKRALYLTDTLRDKNGVSSSLSAKLKYIQEADMPVDFLICHEEAEAESHLHVVKPITSFSLPEFGEQEFRMPDLMQIAKLFYEGSYDRIVCSTEGPMALVSIFIKHMFNVPGFFFMHTDWLDFIRDTTELNPHELDRIRRALRVFYKLYDGVFVLNSEHREWLIGHQMMLDEDKVHLTAHHTQQADDGIVGIDKSSLFKDATPATPVMLYAGRLSKEKGILDLPAIMDKVRQKIPDIRLVIAGTGPAENELRRALPEAHFTGWVDKRTIASLYKGLDLFVFPSTFDTFGNVILEANVYGMPVIAYNCKGPKDLIVDGVSGYLVENTDGMAACIINHFSSQTDRKQMQHNAMLRAEQYQAEPIMKQFMRDMGLADEMQDSKQVDTDNASIAPQLKQVSVA